MGPKKPTEEYFNRGLWGWRGSQWRKLPILWGYTAQYIERISDTDLDEGAQYTNGAAVGAGYIYYVFGATARVISATCSQLRFMPYLADGLSDMWRVVPPVSNLMYYIDRQFVMAEGDYIAVRGYDYTAGDDLHVVVWGYKMAVG